MILPQFSDSPLHIQLSFHKVIQQLEETAAREGGFYSQRAKLILAEVEKHPELRKGITSIDQIENNTEVISHLLADLFPETLTNNEIKAVSIPYQALMFNQTQRFKNILQAAGPDFEFNIRGFDDHQIYIAGCCLVLNRFYGTNLDFSRPLFYDIPDAEGIIRHYRITYNADFIDVIPTDKAHTLSQDDIGLLLDNYDDIELWKEKIPPNSFIIKGFALLSLFDVTIENALSIFKDGLLSSHKSPNMQEELESIFRSIFKIPDIHMGFTMFDSSEDKFTNPVFGPNLRSHLLINKREMEARQLLCPSSYQSLVIEHHYFAVSDMANFLEKNAGSGMAISLSDEHVESFILAPVVKNDVLLGVLEVVSPRTKVLNSVNAHKLEIILPYLADTIDRKLDELQNRIQAVIQTSYTTLHPSVNWKFIREAKNYILSSNIGETYVPKQITFKNVFPLYGQVDIGNSSITRNQSVRNDLLKQLEKIIAIVRQLPQPENNTVRDELTELETFIDELKSGIKADTEQYIQHYLENKIHPLLDNSKTEKLGAMIRDYFNQVDALTGDFHSGRRDYDVTLSSINATLATILDKRQAEIQPFYPHYYERFKTDGVEHNIYIGQSIAPTLLFHDEHLRRLRLWQLIVTAEMEIEQYYLKPTLPYQLGVTSLILVFGAPIAIRFRMDEKHFDIDGAYNVRYEVIKKRIDKAYIRDTHDRITKQGTITIIYSKSEEVIEYNRYLHILKSASILGDKIERFDVEDLQGVSGLKALRVEVRYDHTIFRQEGFSYEQLYRELN